MLARATADSPCTAQALQLESHRGPGQPLSLSLWLHFSWYHITSQPFRIWVPKISLSFQGVPNLSGQCLSVRMPRLDHVAKQGTDTETVPAFIFRSQAESRRRHCIGSCMLGARRWPIGCLIEQLNVEVEAWKLKAP